MQVQVVVQVMLEHGFQAVELRGCRVVHVALGSGGLAQGGQLLLAHLVILKFLGIDKGLELVEDFVGHLKVGRIGDVLAVLGDILGGEVKVPLVAHDVVDDALHLAGLDLDVGHDAAALAHLAAVGRVKDACGAVGGGLLVGAVLVAVAVIHLLDEASAGDVVLGDGDLEHAVIGQRACGLYQSLAEGAVADDHGAVEVLQRSGSDLAGTGRAAVDDDGQGNLGVNGVDGGLVGALARLVAAAHDEHLRTLGDKAAHNLDGSLDNAAAIAAQVQDDALDPGVLLEFDDGIAHLLGRFLVEGGQTDVADVVARHAVVGHRVDADGLAVERERLDAVLVVGTHDGQRQVSVGLAPEALAHLVGGPACRAVAVDDDDAVTGAQADPCCGTTLIGAADVDTLLAVHGALGQVTADAAVLAGAHRHEFVGLDGGNVLGIGVYLVEHRVDGVLDGLLGVDSVDVEGVQFLVQRVEDVQITGHCGVIVDVIIAAGHSVRSSQGDSQATPDKYFERFFHYDYLFVCESTT